MRFLVFGARGWIGSMLLALCRQHAHEAIPATSRLEDFPSLLEELRRVAPDRVLNCAGVTGRPNVDWCESHKGETVLANVCGALNLAHACSVARVHLTNYASGCIYSGGPFSEDDAPNFSGSTYSLTKAVVDSCVARCYPRVCQLRLRMPISDSLDARNFITKITRYEKVVDVPNSMSVLSDLLPLSLDMAVRERCGVFNLVNPGAISHNEILSLYRELVDPSFTWQNFSLEDQAAILEAPRSNCVLSSEKLESTYLVPEIHEAVARVLRKISSSQ